MRSRHKISLALCLSLVGLALILLTLGQAEGQEEEALLQRPVPLGAELGIAGVHTSAGAVVINEVAWGGTAANAAHEWIELYNTTDQPISLDGWQLVSSDGGPSITLSGIIPVFGYYLIERGTDQAISDTPADWVGNFGSGLSNSGEILTLTTPLGQVIDTANGNGGAWPAGSSGAGYRSMERIDPAAPDTDANWASNDGLTRNGLDASGNPINGTPKARNSISRADLVVEKSAPAPARPGGLVTYTLLVRNAYSLTAAAVHLTDTLPTELAFMTQTSPYTFTQLGLATLVWEMGDLPPPQLLPSSPSPRRSRRRRGQR